MKDVEFVDYPEGKFAKKIDWWRSDQGLSLIRGWRAQGMTIKEVLTSMGVDPRTFRRWRKKYPEFDEAMATGVEVANVSVSQALFRKAIGYDYEEKTYELVEGEMRLTKRVTKHVQPDVKAIMHWLYNRDPRNWRALQEPLEETQYLDTVQSILVAMKNVAEGGEDKVIDVDLVEVS